MIRIFSVDYICHANGTLLKSVTDYKNRSSLDSTTYSYDENGTLIQEEDFNFSESGKHNDKITYQYNEEGQLIESIIDDTNYFR